eukprot:6482416-Amphidinium_carterae.1
MRVPRRCPETRSVERKCNQRRVAKVCHELKLDPHTDRSRDAIAEWVKTDTVSQCGNAHCILESGRPGLLECSKTLASYMSAPRKGISFVSCWTILDRSTLPSSGVPDLKSQESPSHITVAV